MVAVESRALVISPAVPWIADKGSLSSKNADCYNNFLIFMAYKFVI